MRDTFETAFACLGFAGIVGGFISGVGFVTERVLTAFAYGDAHASAFEIVARVLT